MRFISLTIPRFGYYILEFVNMTNEIRLGARLRAARKAAGFSTAKSFLKRHKVPASTYSQHESGARTPDEETLKFYGKIFGVNINWLQNGEGQPFNKINLTQKNILNEELIDLKHWKPDSSTINQEILNTILTELISIHNAPLSSRQTKIIVKHVTQIYTDIISSSTSPNVQKQMIKPAVATYKRFVRRDGVK